jgi:hypothetical protein
VYDIVPDDVVAPAQQVWPGWFPHRAQIPDTHRVPDAVQTEPLADVPVPQQG